MPSLTYFSVLPVYASRRKRWFVRRCSFKATRPELDRSNGMDRTWEYDGQGGGHRVRAYVLQKYRLQVFEVFLLNTHFKKIWYQIAQNPT